MSEPDLQALSAELRQKGCAFHHREGPGPRLFQVMGERASGTNVVRKAIEQNLDLKRSDGLGWKHGFPSMAAIPQSMLVICLFRNAVDWSLSMHKRPWHAHPDLLSMPYPDFIRAQWRTVVDRVSDFDWIDPQLGKASKGRVLQYDRHPITGDPFANLFVLRHAKMVSLLGLRNRLCHFAWIKLEAFQNDPELVLSRLCNAFDVSPLHDEFKGVKRRMGTRYTPMVRDRPETPSEQSAEDREFMRSQLDLRVEALLGYEY